MVKNKRREFRTQLLCEGTSDIAVKWCFRCLSIIVCLSDVYIRQIYYLGFGYPESLASLSPFAIRCTLTKRQHLRTDRNHKGEVCQPLGCLNYKYRSLAVLQVGHRSQQQQQQQQHVKPSRAYQVQHQRVALTCAMRLLTAKDKMTIIW